MNKIKQATLSIVIILVIATLFSCRQTPIAGPVSLNYDYKTYVLEWEKINKATKYIIDINGMLYESNTNTYSFKDAEKGLYKVKVKAIFKNDESIFSNTLSFIVSEYINLAIYSDGNYIYWETITNATYEVSYLNNLSVIKIETSDYRFLLPEILKVGTNNITLKAFVDDKLLSEQMISLDFNSVRIYKNSPHIVRVHNANEIYINGKKTYGVSIRPDNIRMSASLIFNYSGEIFVSITGEENILKKVLILPEPFILESFYIQPYLKEDVKFVIDFKNYYIKSITNLSFGVDYKIEGLNNLVITKSYIEKFINDNPTETKIELNVVLESNNTIYEIYLEIDLN